MKTETVEIKDTKYLRDYRLRIKFSDKSEKIIDFAPFLKKAQNPMTRKYLNKTRFKNFQIKYGDLVWGDYEMCFPIWDLHEGSIE